MYRISEKMKKMTRWERYKAFEEAASAFPPDKDEFTAEELKVSRDYCAYEMFRNLANLDQVGYFYFANAVLKERFKNHWAEIEEEAGFPKAVYIQNLLLPYNCDLDMAEGDDFSAVTAIDDFWGGIQGKNYRGEHVYHPFFNLRRIKLLTDEDMKERYSKFIAV